MKEGWAQKTQDLNHRRPACFDTAHAVFEFKTREPRRLVEAQCGW